MDQIKIGAFMAAVRKEKDMTQEQFGERLGVSQRTVSRWETGRNMPDISMLPVICDVLDINIAELMAGERIEGDRITKGEATNLFSATAEIVRKKHGLRNVMAALLSAVITLVLMVSLYNYEFSVSVTSTADLERGLNAYRFGTDITADVLESVSVGKTLFVLYRQDGHPTAGGLARLERGVFGRYRIIGATDFNWTLCQAYPEKAGGREYLAVFCINDLPDVDTVVFYGDDRKTEPLFSVPMQKTPFLTVTESDKDAPRFSPFWSRYFDASGREIEQESLLELLPSDQGASRSGAGTAELWLIYAFEIILLLLGVVFVRYFLTGGRNG